MSKRKSRRAPHYLFTFAVAEAFPHDDPLAVDLVRLMATYNDMTEITDWILSLTSIPTKPIARRSEEMRKGIQFRLLLAFLHEALIVLGEMQGTQEFKDTVSRLNQSGKDALDALRQSSSNEMASFRTRLTRARNNATFHYDRPKFADALCRYTQVFEQQKSVKSEILLKPNSRSYFPLAEGVRDIIAGDYKNKMDVDNATLLLSSHVKSAIALQKQLYIFIDNLLKSYFEGKGFAPSSFERKVIYE